MISLAVITLTLLFVFRSLEQVGDALLYANKAKVGGLDFIPKKLLLGSILAIFYSTLTSITNCDVIFAAQIHNFIWATMAILALYVAVEHMTDSRMTAFVAALFTLVTNGFWIWSNQADAYLPVLSCFALLAMLLIKHENTLSSGKHTLLLSTFIAMSVLYHQVSVLFCVAVGIYLLYSHGRFGLQKLMSVLVISGGVVLSLYVAAYLYRYPERTLMRFIDYTLRGATALPIWGTFENYTIKGARELLASQVGNIVIIPRSLEVLRKIVKLILASAFTFVFVWNVYKVIKKAPGHQARLFYLTWWLIYSLFSLWWLPTYRQLIVSTIVPIVALGSLTLCDLRVNLRSRIKRIYGIVGISLIIASIFTSNLLASVLPMRSSRGEAYEEARKLFAIAGEECLTMSGWRDGLSLEYYFNRKPLYIRQQLRKFFYVSQAPEKRLALVSSKNLCSAGALKYVLPSHCIDNLDGYTKPVEWLAFVEWLFQVKYNALSKHLTYSIMETVVDDANDVYLIIHHSSRRTVPGIGVMFEELDRAVSGKQLVPTSGFYDWYVEFKSLADGRSRITAAVSDNLQK
jgi:hypothetical protein